MTYCFFFSANWLLFSPPLYLIKFPKSCYLTSINYQMPSHLSSFPNLSKSHVKYLNTCFSNPDSSKHIIVPLSFIKTMLNRSYGLYSCSDSWLRKCWDEYHVSDNMIVRKLDWDLNISSICFYWSLLALLIILNFHDFPMYSTSISSSLILPG